MPLFLSQLKADGTLDNVYMTVCNIGSRKIREVDDYADAGWKIFAPNLMILGFDADPEACEAANSDFEHKAASWVEAHLPYALSHQSGPATLHITEYPGCISLYEPKQEFLNRFINFGHFFQVKDQVTLETTTLDAVCMDEEIESIDFLQIDVQGANLDVLKGASDLLDRSVFAIQVESEFSPLYHQQALFADIDQYLRHKGFTLFSFLEPQRKPRAEIFAENQPGQLLWADALYLRDPLQTHAPEWTQTAESLLKVACIADLFNLPDYAIELMTVLTQKYHQNAIYNVADSVFLAIEEAMNDLPESIHQFGFAQKLQPYLSPEIQARIPSMQ
ncbi:FkbM family methyltransferase [filamentous cyanobacterium LEGE 11480]|uniref:FkbM family methyltransferase n=1 Tax=Romeriopsis navalis LEGE 11480 TaxID=2777977 RepID=A0A928Z1Q5_9CYAN|nr:FkbM family methyltransferase [Romeriopsis navalis]MBE9028744.1 FkbM family methyltransferase [Romeriopsis navalis LEGE 11480]